MAASTVTFEAVRQQIAKKQFAPVYLLHGEEGYFLDVLAKDFENAIPEEDRAFDERILYAPEVQPGQVMDICKGFPMMGDKQMVILKEAQAVRADQINRLARYVKEPSSSTVLVIIFRGAAAKGKDLLAAAKAKAVVYESKKIRDYQLLPYIANYIKEKGLTADIKAQEMLRDFIGANLSQLFNEIDKLATILGQGACITPEAIERNIGFSKEFNNFELIDAISVRDVGKAMRIIEYFAANPKANPTVTITAALYGYFSNLLVAIYSPDKSEAALMKATDSKAPIQVRKYTSGMRMYNAFQVIEIIWALRQFDARSKGVGSRQNSYDLLHDLIFHILSAPGNLGV